MMSYWDYEAQKIINRPDKPSSMWPGWTEIDCTCCNGLEWGGEYPRECSYCNEGTLFRHEASGVLAQYPGGPFLGRQPRVEQVGEKNNE